jgi:hypothetical protein
MRHLSRDTSGDDLPCPEDVKVMPQGNTLPRLASRLHVARPPLAEGHGMKAGSNWIQLRNAARSWRETRADRERSYERQAAVAVQCAIYTAYSELGPPPGYQGHS